MTVAVKEPTRGAQPEARTFRKDRWWLMPALHTTGFAIFLVYATTRVLLQNNYWVADYHYLTPFYSPCISASCAEGSSHFGSLPWAFPWFIPFAAVSLPFLLLFRLTCYYYRRAYYRSVWFSPPACAVREPHGTYTGERRFPLIGQNLHRYFFYISGIIAAINTYDAILAFRGADGGFGLGLGNVILLGNVVLLWCYTMSCHSCRHAFGGRLTHFSRHPVRYWMWTQVSKMNVKHMQFAWITLGTLMLTDAYVALVAGGAFPDPRFIN